MRTFSTTLDTPAIAIRRIVRALVMDEPAFMATAKAMALNEDLADVLERFLTLQRDENFNRFFAFLSHRAPDLISPCHWLAFGPKLIQGRGAPKVPTFGQLQQVLQLVREERPRLQEFTRLLIAASVFGKVAGVEPARATSRPIEPSSATVAVAQ